MSAEVMVSFLKTCTPQERFGFRIAVQCAPVLKDVKVSNLITLRPGGCRSVRRNLKQSRIVCILLYADSRKEVLYLYRPERLSRHLARRDVRAFLNSCGYVRLDPASVLQRLRKRYRLYAEAGGAFPHEIGVLLEYPVEDVEGFIINRGENSLTARYWKVYHNPAGAQEIFRRYDEAKEQALTEIMGGFLLGQVAVS